VIELGALRSRVRTELRPNLSIVIDAGFAQGGTAWRFADPSWGAGIQWWGTGGAVERISLSDAAIGGLNFLPAGIRYIVRPPAPDAATARRHPRQRGRQAAQPAPPADEGITARALAFLADAADSRGTARGRRGGDAMVVLRDESADPPLAHALAIARAAAALDRIDRLPLREAETLLQRRLQTGGAPMGLRRELGIVYAALREWASAVQELQRADIEQREAGAPYDADLHFHLGLARFEKGALADAVAEFDELVVKAPDHALARYLHVRAIDRLIKAGLNELRRRSAEAYLRLGAPLGHADEIANPDAAR
jgi:tetratricopeptide (TPR) repeat protein